MELAGFDDYSGFPVVFLSDNQQRIILPVPVAIIKLPMFKWALDEVIGATDYSGQPSTHQLLMTIIQMAGGQIKGVLIDQLNDGFYLARIIVEDEGRIREFACESTDAIIIAVILNQPILVSSLMIDRYTVRLDEHGQPEWPMSDYELDRLQKLAED